MPNYDEFVDRLMDALIELDYHDLIGLWNEYCEDCRYDDDYIYQMYDLDELCGSGTMSEMLDKIDLSEFNPSDNYFQYTIYGIQSFDSVADRISGSDLAKWVLDGNGDVSDFEEVQEILDEYNADEEEEE